MSSMENQYLKENPRGAAVLYFTIALGILVTLAVLLRFMARRCIKAAFAADDWWILGSLVPLYGMIILGALCMLLLCTNSCTLLNPRGGITWGGLGRPIAGHSPSQIAVFLKVDRASLFILRTTDPADNIS